MPTENECQRNSNTTHKSTIFDGYNTPFSIRAPSVFATFICAKVKVTTSKEEELTFWGQGYFQIYKEERCVAWTQFVELWSWGYQGNKRESA